MEAKLVPMVIRAFGAMTSKMGDQLSVAYLGEKRIILMIFTFHFK